MRLIASAALLAALGFAIAFALLFEPGRHQFDSNFLWPAAIVSLGLASCLNTRPTRPFPVPSRIDVAAVVSMNLIFFALWLPHYDNWRWAYTGDSIAWHATSTIAAQRGLDRNLLSMRGVDFHFTYLHSLGSNALMFVFEPTLFWHRVGKMLASALSLTAIFWFFRVTVGRWWGLAIAISAATNFYLVRMSYVSYGHIDSFIFCFNAFTLTALIWRRRDDTRLWLLAGLNAGMSLYFTQTAWSGVATSGLCLIGLAVWHRRFYDLAYCGAAFATCAIPVALQWNDFLHLISSQTKPNLEWSYLAKMTTAVFELPYLAHYTSTHRIPGGFLRPPLGQAYLVGIALSAAAILPFVRRWLRLPRVAPAVLAMLAIEIVLMTVTNNGYGAPSSNRTYHLIPLQLFLACVPLIALGNRLREVSWAKPIAIGAALASLGMYAHGNLQILLYPPDRLFGSKTTDGLIELHQRHPDVHSVYFVSAPAEMADYARGSFFDKCYGISSSVTAAEKVDAESINDACSAGSLLCCHRSASCAWIDRVLKDLDWEVSEYPTVNSGDLRCSRCTAKTARGTSATAISTRTAELLSGLATNDRELLERGTLAKQERHPAPVGVVTVATVVGLGRHQFHMALVDDGNLDRQRSRREVEDLAFPQNRIVRTAHFELHARRLTSPHRVRDPDHGLKSNRPFWDLEAH